MPSRPTVSRFLPSITAARKAGLGLPAGEPFDVQRLAALRVHMRVLRRVGWSEQQSFRPEEYAALLADVPPDGKAGTTYHVKGKVLRRTAHWVRCQVHHITDELVELHETYVPSLIRNHSELFRVESALEALIMPVLPPEELRCRDLSPKEVGGAYRSGPTQKAPDFHGFDFSDALTQAATVVNRMRSRGQLLREDVRVYAWPLLWLRYGELRPEPDYVLVVDPRGVLHAIAGVVFEPTAG